MKKLLTLCCLLLPLFAFAAQADESQKDRRTIAVQVKMAPNLAPSDADKWTLYVYAAKPNTRLPLSNFKGKLSQLPAEVLLDESMYLLPHLTLRQAEEVVIIAKASKSKNPHQKSSDDLIGYSGPISFSSGDQLTTNIIIDQHDITK